MSLIEVVAGDSFAFNAPLTDAETGESLDESTVSLAWVQVGSSWSKTLSDSEVSKVTGAIQTQMSGSDTETLSGTLSVHVKVKLSDGRECTLTPNTGSPVRFVSTVLTDNHS